MPIFHEHNAIFVHIPKTGGTTVLRMFGYYSVPNNDMFYHIDDLFEYDHASAQLIKSRVPEKYNSFYKFTIVRNPYDRLVSEFFWKKKDHDIRTVDVKDLNFKQFVEHLYANFDKMQSQIQREKSHLLPQSSFVLDDVEVFKFENMNECLDTLSIKYNLVRLDEKFNKTDHPDYLSVYDKDTAQMVYDMYFVDFKLFGYDKLQV